MIALIFLLSIFCFPNFVHAAVLFVAPASGSSSVTDGGVAGVGFSFNATGMDFLMACAAVRDVGAGNPILAFTYNAAALTSVASVTISTAGGFFHDVHLYRLVAPTAGSNSLLLTLTNSSDGIILGAMGFSGVHAGTPLGTPATDFDAGSASTTKSITPASATDELPADCFGIFASGAGDEVISYGAGQTETFSDAIVGVDPQANGSWKAGAAGTTLMERVWSNFLYGGLIGVSLKPAAVVPPSGVARRRIINQ